MSAASYARQLLSLLPRGAAWPKDVDSGIRRMMDALSVEFSRVDGRAGDDLMRETLPTTTVEMLPDWEDAFGLPDPCIEAERELTLQERRELLRARVTSVGGQSPAYYIGVAADLGYVISITEFRPFRAGMSVAGDSLTNGDWAFTWQVNSVLNTVRKFRAGIGAAGEPLAVWGNEQLECALERIKPAHTILNFAYRPRNVETMEAIIIAGDHLHQIVNKDLFDITGDL